MPKDHPEYPLIADGVVNAHLAFRNVLADAGSILRVCVTEQVGSSPPEAVSVAQPKDSFAELKVRSDALDNLMRRERYRVGLAGESQIGKSTAVRNFLGVDSDQSPTTDGTGRPTTAVPTRIYALPLGAEPTCTVYYLTTAQYRERVQAITEFFHLPIDLSEAEIKARLAQLFADSPKSQELLMRILVARRPRTPENIRAIRDYFICLLESYAQFGAKLVRTDVPFFESVKYSRRSKYIDHPEKYDAPAPMLLVREASIGFPTIHIHPKLDMIDLPGLGTVNATDDLTTEFYLPELQGVVVFRLATIDTDIWTPWLMKKCEHRYQKQVAQRTWLCLTYFENLSKAHMEGKAGEGQERITLFDGILKTLTDLNLGVDNLTLLSKACFDKRETRRGHEAVSHFWPMEEGRPIQPPALKNHEPLWALIRDTVFTDGGISRLRMQLSITLAERVEEAEKASTLKELRALKKELRNLCVNSKTQLLERGQQSSRQCARDWANCIRTTLAHVLRPHGPVDDAAKVVEKSLQAVFDKMCRLDVPRTEKEIQQKHNEDWALELCNQSKVLACGNEGVPKICRIVTAALQGANLPPLRLDDKNNPAEVWESLVDADSNEKDKAWNTWFDSFAKVKLFADRDPVRLNLTDYRGLMTEKITVTVQQAFDDVAVWLEHHLNGISSKLEGFLTKKEMKPSDTTFLIGEVDRLLTQLDALEV